MKKNISKQKGSTPLEIKRSNGARKRKTSLTGFTLMELVVALAVFSVVIAITMTIFSWVTQGQRKIIALQNVQENTRYVTEAMAKEIRMGTKYSVLEGGKSLRFTNQFGEQIIYSLNPDTNRIEKERDGVDLGPITSDDIKISNLEFDRIAGSGNQQERVTLTMTVEGTGGKTEQQAKIDLQISLSRRCLVNCN